MRAPTAREVLAAWEAGARRHPVDRAILLLWLASPDATEDELWDLCLGDRNRLLLDWFQKAAGPRLECFTRCSHCNEPNEFVVPVQEIRFVALPAPIEPLIVDGCSIRFRQPSSRDLAAATKRKNVGDARQELVRCCIVSATRDGVNVQSSELSDVVLARVSAAIREQDPQVDQECEVVCASCGKTTSALLDVVAFAWSELSRWAKNLLQDVDRLARVYGWREVDILEMSAQRRSSYLELISG